MLDSLRRRLARLIAPGSVATRRYASAGGSRLHAWGSSLNSSADAELSTSLTALRTRSRKLMRDSPYAKRARVVVVNNVIGAGVGMQAQVRNTRGGLHTLINADIEEAWRQWSRADACHTGGTLSFADLERACLSEVVTAGEVFIRKHYRAFGDSRVPLGLELIEAERVVDEFSFPTPENQATRLGIERDQFGRPIAYYIRNIHPGEIRLPAGQDIKIERVPAADIIHLRVVDRWPMTRGEPWLHNVIAKLDNMDEYTAAELTAARMGANFFATLETDADNGLATSTDMSTGAREMQIEPGVIEQLAPGDKLNFHTPNRPNVALDPFLRYMLREVAAGIGCSYESLSRDYSQSNYSSSSLALLDDRDLWRVLQQWYVRSFREPLLRDWMQAAVLSRAIGSIQVEQYAPDPERFLAVTWKLRGWQWVDPTKEVNAYKEAVKAGFTTVSAVIAQTAGGVDVEDVIAERQRELEMFDAAGIDLDTTVEEPVEPVEPPGPTAPQLASEDDAAKKQDEARAAIMRVLNDAELRGEMRGRSDATAEAVALVAKSIERKQTVFNVAAPEVNVPATVVNVAPAAVTVQPAEIRIEPAAVNVEAPVVNVAAPDAPVINVAPAQVEVRMPEQPAPVVNVAAAPAPQVNVTVPRMRPTRTVVERKDKDGRIVATRTEEI